MLSKTYILGWAALSILLLGGCRTEKSEQEHAEPNEQKPKASEAVLPTTFKFSMSFAPGPSGHSLVWDGEALIRYEGPHFFGEAKITKTVTPSAEQWRAFWQKMEEVKVWEWRPRYYTPAYDGVTWGLVLEHGGRKVTSGGSNGYPSDEDVTATAGIGSSEVFNKFREAVGALMVSAFSAEKSEQEQAEPNEPGAKASETLLPRALRFNMVSAPMIRSYKLVWDSETLTYETSGFPRPKITKVVPSAEQWRAFWEKMEDVKVWEWRGRYEPNAVVYDGVSWGLQIEHGNRKVTSSGNNAYPSEFGKFREAVRELAGKETFW